MTFREIVEQHYLPWSGIRHSPGHHKEQARICTQHLLPVYGERRLHEIRRADIKAGLCIIMTFGRDSGQR